MKVERVREGEQLLLGEQSRQVAESLEAVRAEWTVGWANSDGDRYVHLVCVLWQGVGGGGRGVRHRLESDHLDLRAASAPVAVEHGDDQTHEQRVHQLVHLLRSHVCTDGERWKLFKLTECT